MMGTHCLDITLHFMECENMILEDMILEETSCFISDNLFLLQICILGGRA